MRWIQAAPGAEMLGFESCILMKQMEPDAWLEGGIGEVADAARITTLEYAPRGTGRDHVCGTQAEFDTGGTYDPVAPLVKYGALGIPLCCNPPKRVRGGAGASGRAHLVVQPLGPPPPTAISPDISCGASDPGHPAPWSFQVFPDFLPFHWIKLTGLVAGQQYRITVFPGGPVGLVVKVDVGTDCGNLTEVVPYSATPYSADWTQIGTNAWVQCNNFFAPWTFWVRAI